MPLSRAQQEAIMDQKLTNEMTNAEIRNQIVDNDFSTVELYNLATQKDDPKIARVALSLYLRRRKMEAGY